MSERELAATSPPFQVGETFVKTMTLDADSIRTFAAFIGDTNPMHHDEALARKSRFGGLIASGAQTSALMGSLTAAIVTERTPSLGLEMNFRFQRVVLADEPLRIEWEVAAIEAKPSWNGHVITFKGRMLNEKGEVAVSGQAKTLVFPKWPESAPAKNLTQR